MLCHRTQWAILVFFSWGPTHTASVLKSLSLKSACRKRVQLATYCLWNRFSLCHYSISLSFCFWPRKTKGCSAFDFERVLQRKFCVQLSNINLKVASLVINLSQTKFMYLYLYFWNFFTSDSHGNQEYFHCPHTVSTKWVVLLGPVCF